MGAPQRTRSEASKTELLGRCAQEREPAATAKRTVSTEDAATLGAERGNTK